MPRLCTPQPENGGGQGGSPPWFDRVAGQANLGLTGKTLRFLAVLVAATAGLLFISTLFDRLELRYALVINIGLAAVPALCAILLVNRGHKNKKGLLGILWWVIWAVFFPNAPYMLTDLIHVKLYEYPFGYSAEPDPLAWLGLVYIAAAVAVGCCFGFLSLYLLQQQVKKRFSAAWGWAFCGGAGALAGIAIFIGRFMRFNSWDIIKRPLALLQEMAARLNGLSLALVLLFTFMTLGAYLLFYFCYDDRRPAETKGSE